MDLVPKKQRRYIIRKYLIDFLVNNDYQPGDKLPSERELMEEFGVSRLSMREALHLLSDERIVRPMHGMGWYLMENPKLPTEDISQLKSVTQIFKTYGLKIHTEVLSFKVRKLEKEWRAMNLKVNEEILSIERIRFSKKDPFIYSIDEIPVKLFKKLPHKQEFEGSLLKLLEEKYKIKVEYSHAKISVVEQKDFESSHSALKDISSWLLLEQVNYNNEGVPVIYSRDYHRSDKLHFFVRRYVTQAI